MWHKDKRERKKKHQPKHEWWQDFSYFGSKKWLKQIIKRPKRSKGSITTHVNNLYEKAKKEKEMI